MGTNLPRKAINVTDELIREFWSKVEKTDDCWLWTGTIRREQYGFLGNTRVHRLSWVIHRGPIPEGLLVCHSCDVMKCVRPKHLFLGTHLDNTADMFSKGREHARRGAKNGNNKLTEEIVTMVRTRIAHGEYQREIARDLGISQGLVSLINTKKLWSHTPCSRG